jgi:hypothetical protein
MLLDETRTPILVLNLDESESVDQILATLADIFRRGGRYVLLADATRRIKASFNALGRKAVTDFLQREREALKRSLVGIVTIHDSTFVRGIITAVRWVAPMPVPDAIFARMDDGMAWAKKQLGDKAGT